MEMTNNVKQKLLDSLSKESRMVASTAYAYLRASGQIQDKDRYIPVSEAKKQMVAMLEELKSEMNPIKECEQQIYGKENWNFVRKCQDVIQQKIDKMKGENNGIHEN